MNSEQVVNAKGYCATHHECCHRCVSWSAILMGALVAVTFGFLLNLLSLGIGLSVYSSTPDNPTVFAVGGFVGLVIFAFLTMMPAGFVAGKLGGAHCTKKRAGELYGIATWAVGFIITVLLASSIGNFVNQTTYLVNRNAINLRVVDLARNDTYQVQQNAPNNNTKTEVMVDPEKAAQATALATFATFFIYFMGLVASCLGGRMAVICNRRCMNQNGNCGVNTVNTVNK